MDNFSDLTVVIKTILRYRCLKHTVDSFLAIEPSLKIIVIDDSPVSKRQSPEFPPNVNHVFTEEDIGVCAGRNLGFKLAKTKYVLYTDDDDSPNMSKEVLLENLNFVRNNNCDLLGYMGANISKNDEKRTIDIVRKKINGLEKVDLTGNSYIAKREFLLKNLYNEKIKIIGEHYSFFYKLKEKNSRVFASSSFKFKKGRVRNPEYNKFRSRNFREFAVEEIGYSANWIKGNGGCCNS